MKKYLLNLIPFILTALCFVAYNLIGSEVLPDGTLSEPFFLIPISWFFFLNRSGLVNNKYNFVIYTQNKEENLII